ncbi:MAG: bifunctional 5,10-methylenetetrahydrofolate dehydrogenase/5,10-methenyltetrahydrofolate cyclohydrolase, partial [Elusimicrobiaceae bacterium]|nr:bifunctional 5,10-methylenetetrahydrofolate dehydrogenase/5,10-methenyltetrahydrofolate cyclohydrolase [Elusimicrobiaceae bacterium]
ACRALGMTAQAVTVAADSEPDGFVELVRRAGADPDNDALLIPQPLPKRLRSSALWAALEASKDIDGASVVNMGRLFKANRYDEIAAEDFFVPCTALAVTRLLRYHNIQPAGRSVTVIGRSATVGRPLAHLLACMDATVTLCHSKTPDIKAAAKEADILISAVGSARWLGADMVKPGAVVIDVGTNQDAAGKFCGDVDFDAVAPAASAITPVPGGVGPVTLACLLENIVRSAQRA